ncbi:MAG: hypothetical protein ACRD3G_20895 [Vicinamibacterales bacterium]
MSWNSKSGNADGNRESGFLVIFTRVEGLLRERTPDASDATCAPLRFLASHGVPLVLVSAWDETDIPKLQNDFSLVQPFI